MIGITMPGRLIVSRPGILPLGHFAIGTNNRDNDRQNALPHARPVVLRTPMYSERR
jgi:hypothetical protein